jgi:hypothetical protein
MEITCQRIDLSIVQYLDEGGLLFSRAWIHFKVSTDKELARHGEDGYYFGLVFKQVRPVRVVNVTFGVNLDDMPVSDTKIGNTDKHPNTLALPVVVELQKLEVRTLLWKLRLPT